jgi:hypothetical protein
MPIRIVMRHRPIGMPVLEDFEVRQFDLLALGG